MKEYTVVGYYEEEPQIFAALVEAEDPQSAAQAAVRQLCRGEAFAFGVLVVVAVLDGEVPVRSPTESGAPVRATELLPGWDPDGEDEAATAFPSSRHSSDPRETNRRLPGKEFVDTAQDRYDRHGGDAMTLEQAIEFVLDWATTNEDDWPRTHRGERFSDFCYFAEVVVPSLDNVLARHRSR